MIIIRSKKIIIFATIFGFLHSHVFSADLKMNINEKKNKYDFETYQLIEFRLTNDTRMVIKYLSKTNEYLWGNVVEYNEGKYKVKKEKVKIYYEDIKSFFVISSTDPDRINKKILIVGAIIVFGLVIVLITIAILSVEFSKHFGLSSN